jgi:hypothetical protein
MNHATTKHNPQKPNNEQKMIPIIAPMLSFDSGLPGVCWLFGIAKVGGRAWLKPARRMGRSVVGNIVCDMVINIGKC